MMFDRRSGLTIVNAFFDCLAPVHLFFSFANRDFDLRFPFFEINGERDAGKALLRDHAEKLVDLPAVKQELACPNGIDIQVSLNLGIGRDVAIKKVKIFADRPHKTVAQIDLPLSDRFHLVTLKRDPGLETILKKIIEVGLAIDGDWFHISSKDAGYRT